MTRAPLPHPRRTYDEQVRALAADITDLVSTTGAATDTDLCNLGWSLPQIAELLPEARKIMPPVREVCRG